MNTRSTTSKRVAGSLYAGLFGVGLAVNGCSSDANQPAAPDLLEPPSDTVSTITVVHLNGDAPPTTSFRYVRQSELTNGTTIESIQAVTCGFQSPGYQAVLSDAPCNSGGNLLCVTNDAYPQKSTVDLNSFCRVRLGRYCIYSWAQAVQSYSTGGLGVYASLYQVCGEDCSSTLHCDFCSSEEIRTPSWLYCFDTNSVGASSSGLCLSGSNDC